MTLFIAVPIMIPTPPVRAAHVVEPGDAFWKVAQAYDMELSDLIKLNPHISNPNRINPGDKMVVRSGDTASDIVDYARALQGVTVYQYGGQQAPKLTDCSGWVQTYLQRVWNQSPESFERPGESRNPDKIPGYEKRGPHVFLDEK